MHQIFETSKLRICDFSQYGHKVSMISHIVEKKCGGYHVALAMGRGVPSG